jgi:hypothetical protein
MKIIWMDNLCGNNLFMLIHFHILDLNGAFEIEFDLSASLDEFDAWLRRNGAAKTAQDQSPPLYQPTQLTPSLLNIFALFSLASTFFFAIGSSD